MNFFSLLRKPAWEHKDAARRAAAVAGEEHPDLLARLPDLARTDPDPAVRLAAVRRIDDLSLLGDRARHDEAASVRELARQRYVQRLIDARVPRAERERVLAVEEDSEILATVAQQAPEAALRQLAFERVPRPGLLADRCVTDPDPALRRWLLDRIEDISTLERIAERARKSDKLLSRTARERVQAARLAAGDPAATAERALAICEELDSLRRTAAPGAPARREALAAEWDALRPRLDAAMERRVAGYFSALDAALAPPEPALPLPEPEPLAEPVVAPPPREPDTAIAALLAELEARAARLGPRELEDLERRWLARLRQIEPLLPEEHAQESRFRARAGALHRQFEETARKRQAALETLAERVAQLEAAIGAGHVAAARELERSLQSDARLLADHFPRGLRGRLAEANRGLATLGRWQHWSDNKARLRLIEDAEAVPSAGLHPDAVAARIKELQVEWQKLDEAAGRDAGAHPLTGRFRGACHRALAPARPYFEKRRELRGARREESEAFLTELEPRLAGEAAIGGLLTLRRQVIDQLRLADELEPGARREIGRRLREALDRVNAAVARCEAEAEAGKRKLLANLRRDLMHAELDAALPLARQAQTAWKTLPRAARKVDDALWKELRELVDPWFTQSDARQREQRAAESAAASEAGEILAELDALARADAAALAHAEARLAALQSRWRALAQAQAERHERPASDERRPARGPRRAPDRAALDERAFDRAVAQVRAACARQAEARRRDELRRLQAAGSVLDQAEALVPGEIAAQREEIAARLEAMALPADARAALQARLDALDEGAAEDAGEATARAEELTVLAELALERESPASARELRRRIQIERLSRRLAGEEVGDELRALLLAYVGLRGVPPSCRSALAGRWQALLGGDA